MQKGDRVKLIDEKGVFIIERIEGKNAILIDEYGFEYKYPLHTIILATTMGNAVSNFDADAVKLEKQNTVSKTKQKNIKKKEVIETKEVDLHIGHLVDSYKNMQPHQMLQKQLNTARVEIEEAKKNNSKKLILIHGKGKGVLKTELYKLLDSIADIEYWEADVVKYRLGAVEIRFK